MRTRHTERSVAKRSSAKPAWRYVAYVSAPGARMSVSLPKRWRRFAPTKRAKTSVTCPMTMAHVTRETRAVGGASSWASARYGESSRVTAGAFGVRRPWSACVKRYPAALATLQPAKRTTSPRSARTRASERAKSVSVARSSVKRPAVGTPSRRPRCDPAKEPAPFTAHGPGRRRRGGAPSRQRPAGCAWTKRGERARGEAREIRQRVRVAKENREEGEDGQRRRRGDGKRPGALVAHDGKDNQRARGPGAPRRRADLPTPKEERARAHDEEVPHPEVEPEAGAPEERLRPSTGEEGEGQRSGGAAALVRREQGNMGKRDVHAFSQARARGSRRRSRAPSGRGGRASGRGGRVGGGV